MSVSYYVERRETYVVHVELISVPQLHEKNDKCHIHHHGTFVDTASCCQKDRWRNDLHRKDCPCSLANLFVNDYCVGAQVLLNVASAACAVRSRGRPAQVPPCRSVHIVSYDDKGRRRNMFCGKNCTGSSTKSSHRPALCWRVRALAQFPPQSTNTPGHHRIPPCLPTRCYIPSTPLCHLFGDGPRAMSRWKVYHVLRKQEVTYTRNFQLDAKRLLSACLARQVPRTHGKPPNL